MTLDVRKVAHAALGLAAKKPAAELLYHCPRHDDQHPSLKINPKKNAWLCGPCGKGGNAWELVAFLAHLDPNDKPAVTTWLRQHGLLNGRGDEKRIVAVYDYTDQHGKLLYQKVRYHPKSFALRQPEGKGGFIYDLKGIKPVLYNLPKVAKAEFVLLVEGEKDVETAEKLGFVATTSGAAGSWKPELAEHFRGKRVPVIVDADEPGRRHARQQAADLVAVAECVKMLEMPGAKDLSEWAEKGGTPKQLFGLIKATPALTAEDVAGNIPSNEAAGAFEEKPVKKSQADKLVALASTEGIKLFHTPEGVAYATVLVGQHEENWAINSTGFGKWLRWRFYQTAGKAPSTQAYQTAVATIAAQATFEGPECPVFVRIAGDDDVIYLDLVNDAWQAVRVDAKGWTIIDNPPVRFIRRRGMLPLPLPKNGEKLEALRAFVNLPDDAAWVLVLSFLVATFRARGPYPVLVLHGEQGSAKSTLAKLLRELIDPNVAPLRSEPRDARDLIIAASNSWMLSFDNLSHLQPWLSDALCRLATGGGFSTRELYTDAEEMIFDAKRPVILNGIEELATRGDLLDRSLILYLPQIPNDQRKREADFWKNFETGRPHLLGATLDAVSTALRRLPTVDLKESPRMADFAAWVTAAEPAFRIQRISFSQAYMGNRQSANDLVLDSSQVAQAIKMLITAEGAFTGTATDLLRFLNQKVDDRVQREKSWPKNGRALSSWLRRLAPNFRHVGVDIKMDGPKRTVGIEKLGNFADFAFQTSEVPTNENKTENANYAKNANFPTFSNSDEEQLFEEGAL